MTTFKSPLRQWLESRATPPPRTATTSHRWRAEVDRQQARVRELEEEVAMLRAVIREALGDE